ncbi:MAG: hypothetical protein HRT87_00015 [Legionellales bacterium]|nr:hypothetical protein [Legionellales bacterium]
MSNFEDDLMYGYTQHLNHFDKWCEKAKPVLGDIRQCGIIELNSDGTAYIAANCPDIGEQNILNKWYEYENNWSFHKNPSDEIKTETTQFGYEKSEVYEPSFRTSWFTDRKVIGSNTQRISFFASSSPDIYTKLVQNMSLVKKLLKFFEVESQSILEHQQDHKVNLAEKSTNYFKTSDSLGKTEREKTNEFLQSIGILEPSVTISKREWQCIKMLEHGKSAKETGDILGLSNRTIETFFSSLKIKFKVSKKREILEIIN